MLVALTAVAEARHTTETEQAHLPKSAETTDAHTLIKAPANRTDTLSTYEIPEVVVNTSPKQDASQAISTTSVGMGRIRSERIEAVRTENADAAPAQRPGTFDRFTIRESHIRPGATLISPDMAMCPECEAELSDPADRRYRYPFINCTNCGPRYTIIEDLPYDRERTVMNEFAMCPECEAEYHDIRSRRYHAQPDCCGACGPQVFFRPAESGAFRQDQALPAGEDAFRQARKLLADGGILAVKGIGGVHLACDALNPDAVKRLRERKHRPEKPLALMCRSLESARRICAITPAEEKLLTGPERPIVLLAKKPAVHPIPGNERIRQALDLLSFSPRLGVMLPYTPLHSLLLDVTSG